MGEFKHTPGPWFWTEKNGQAVALMAAGGKWVSDPQCDTSNYGLSDHLWTDVSEADAALIAAAPALLGAALALVEADDARSDVQPLYERACKLARAAIASALGEG